MTTLGKALDEAIDTSTDDGPRTIEAEAGSRRAEVDIEEVDRLGVRVGRIRVERESDYDLEAIARDWPRELRDLPDRVEPVEVDPGLGGATLRSRPEEMRDDRFVDIQVRGRTAEVRRLVRSRDAEADFTLTREQLGRMVDDLARGGSDEG